MTEEKYNEGRELIHKINLLKRSVATLEDSSNEIIQLYIPCDEKIRTAFKNTMMSYINTFTEEFKQL